MGNKGSKSGSKPAKKVPKKPAKLTSKDIKFLTKQTGQTKEHITQVFEKFNNNNPDGVLDKKEFTRLYIELRSEPADQIDEIAVHIFNAFDTDKNGSISFNEFMVAYAMTSRGEPRQKLEYAFDLYDADNSGDLDRLELKAVIHGMLDMLGADKKGHSAANLATECLHQLDKNNDGRVSKAEFINGLMENYSLRMLMSPFN